MGISQRADRLVALLIGDDQDDVGPAGSVCGAHRRQHRRSSRFLPALAPIPAACRGRRAATGSAYRPTPAFRLGRAAMLQWCQQLGDGDRGARITEDGVSYRRVGKRAKTIHGLFGWVSYVRVCYARLGGGAGWVPLDDQLGAQRGYTPGCPVLHGLLLWTPAHTRRVWITSMRCSAPTTRAEGPRCARHTR